MSLAGFQQLLKTCKQIPKTRLSVAAAADPLILKAVKEALRQDLIHPVLVGDGPKITKMVLDVGLDPARLEVIHEPDLTAAAHTAARLIGEGKADVLMKGKVNSSDFMRAMLSGEYGLRTGRIVSHLAAYEIPGFDRLLFLTDGGINIAPDLEQKKQILLNAIDFLHRLGITEPKVAILSANEVVSPKMPVTVEAQALVEMARAGEFPGAVVDGPIPLDIAVSEKAARLKGLDSPVAGKADLLLVPNIEAGNILGKSIIYFAHGVMAGVVVGARVPAVMNSRADTTQGKLVSLAMACLGGVAGAGDGSVHST